MAEKTTPTVSADGSTKPSTSVEMPKEPETKEVVAEAKIPDVNLLPKDQPASEAESVTTVEETVDVEAQEEPEEPFTARSDETGDKVYLINNGERRWIRNPETLHELGFDFSDVHWWTFSQLQKYPEREPVDLTIAGMVNPLTGEESAGIAEVIPPEQAAKHQPTPQVEDGEVVDDGKPHKTWTL